MICGVKRLGEKAVPFVLAAIILGAGGLALYWVFLVPILQAPDEPIHLHTAFNIYSAGKLVSVREPLHKWNSDLAGDHVYIAYLDSATNVQSLVFHYSVKVPPDYGTRGYYAELDRNAPTEDSGDLEGKTRLQYGLLTVYPCGYYAALAGWLRIASIFTKRVTSLFFAARIFSVFLLAISLSLMYLTLRELKLGPGRALLLTAIVGFFPMTTFVSSYAQADNLTLAMVMLCCYLTLRVKRSFGTTSLMILLGLALGGLCLTKYHFFAAVFPAVIGLVAAENFLRRGGVGWVKLSTILLAPVLIAMLIQTWITWGANPHLVVPNPSMAHVGLSQALAHGKIAAARYLIEGVGLGFSNFYLNGHTALTGSTFNSFWGDFGWTDAPLVIFSPWKTNIIRNFIAVACVAVFVLTIIRVGQVILRVWRVAKRGRPRRALCILFSNPLLNAYFIFTVMMFGLFMVVRRSFAPQGRNWFPFILAIFLNAVAYAPKALGRGRVSTLVSGALLAGLALYCIIGSCYAIPSIVNRYYNVNAVPPTYSVGAPVSGKQNLGGAIKSGTESRARLDDFRQQ
jgi:hypothetical protein